MAVRYPVGSFAVEPSGETVYARGDQAVKRWDGLLAAFADAGLPDPADTPTINSSDAGSIVGDLYCCVRFLDAAGRVSNVSPISAVESISVTTGSITAATNADPIVITSTSHGLSNDATVHIEGVRGNYAANGKNWTVKNVTTHTFELFGSQGVGAYTGGGTWYQGARDIDYSDIEDPSSDSRVTRKQILRTKDGNANVFYVDLDTDVDGGFSLSTTTITSTKTEANLGTAVALLDIDGKDLNVSRHGEPPAWKAVAVHHYNRLWYMAEKPHREGAVAVTNGSATVTGIGTNFTSEMANWKFYPRGASNTVSYDISSINTSTQAITLSTTYAGTTDPYMKYEVRKGGNERLTMYFSEPDTPYSVDSLKGVTITEEPGAGEWTGGMAFRNWLYLLFEHRIFRFSYSVYPHLDGSSIPAHFRGCLNQNCWQIVEDAAYIMDRKGVYLFGGNFDEPLSVPIQSMFEDKPGQQYQIRWAGKENFFSSHDPQEEVIRWFVSLDGNYYPRHALCYHYRNRRWWVEEYPFPMTSATTGTMAGRRQVFNGSTGKRVFAMNRGNLDGVKGNSGTVRGTVTSSAAYSLTDSAASFDSTMVGYPVLLTDGTGQGQRNIIIAQTSTKLTVKDPWKKLPDTTTTYQVGGFTYVFRSGFYDYVQTEENEKRGVELEFQPTANASRMAMRFYEDDLTNGRTVARTAAITVPQGKGNGVGTTKGEAYHTVDTTKKSGYIQHTMDASRDPRADGRRMLQVEVSGTPNDERHTIRQVTIDGVRGV